MRSGNRKWTLKRVLNKGDDWGLGKSGLENRRERPQRALRGHGESGQSRIQARRQEARRCGDFRVARSHGDGHAQCNPAGNQEYQALYKADVKPRDQVLFEVAIEM